VVDLPQIEVIGSSRWGLPLISHTWSRPTAPRVLLLGGVHGDEIEGVALARALLAEAIRRPAFGLALDLQIIAEVNPDGVLAKTRGNGAGVDLNRNMDTQDWSPIALTERYQPGPQAMSEPETRALAEQILSYKPDLIISLHSWKPMLNVNDAPNSQLCTQVAERIARHTGDRIEPNIGYSTPGCLGTWAALERGIPTLTYEIERGLALNKVVQLHQPAVIDGLKVLEKHS
jgi:protein MpaA